MHRDANQLAAAFVTLARVDSRSDFQADTVQVLADSQRTPDGARRAVEGDEEPIAGGIHLAAAEAADLLAERSAPAPR